MQEYDEPEPPTTHELELIEPEDFLPGNPFPPDAQRMGIDRWSDDAGMIAIASSLDSSQALPQDRRLGDAGRVAVPGCCVQLWFEDLTSEPSGGGRVTSRMPEAHLVGGALAPHDVPLGLALERRQQVAQHWSCRQVTRTVSPGLQVHRLDRPGALVVEVPDRDVEHRPRPRGAGVHLDLDRAAEQVHVPGGRPDRRRLRDRPVAGLHRAGLPRPHSRCR